MKLFRTFLSLIVVSCFSVSLWAQSSENIDKEQLRKEFQHQTEKWKDAYNSKDAGNLVSLYSEDARYISSHVAGLVADGRDRLIANFQNGMNMGGYIDSVEILTLDVSCDLASLLCKYQATNSGVTVEGRNLLIMKKINNVWLIIIHMTVV
jgi:ketosteroid isomerase-like protein